VALSPDAAVERASALLAELDRDLLHDGPKGLVRRYLKGEHDLPYMPRSAQSEYRSMAKRSVTNWLPLVSDTFAKALFVDGFRAADEAKNAPAWDYWQRNRLDARQTVAHRGALDYGVSYVYVLPGDSAPVIRPVSPLRSHAVYLDPDDEWPVFGIVTDGRTDTEDRIVRLFDDEAVYTLTKPKDGRDLEWQTTEEHKLGVCPMIRFRDRLDGDATGIIAPLKTIQDRVNEAVFSLHIALQYASFRQRWATGLAIPVDEDETIPDPADPTGVAVIPNPNFGKPTESFQAAVDRLWVTDSSEAKFGDFDQTDVSGHLKTYVEAVKALAAVAQISPHAMLGDLVNLSADALAAAEATTQRKANEYETLFGEAWEQVLRLAALAAGDSEAAADESAQVRWRDTEARSFAATVDALGKMVQMLGVPPEAAWERIPGVTAQDVEAWKALRASADVFGALVGDLNRQVTANPGTAPAPEVAQPV
jgi:hypothetical protein